VKKSGHLVWRIRRRGWCHVVWAWTRVWFDRAGVSVSTSVDVVSVVVAPSIASVASLTSVTSATGSGP